jgi:CubicO group peptidase (beta-lactamase class C family)
MAVFEAGNERVRRAVEAVIANGDEVGVQVCAYHRNRCFVDVAAGFFDRAKTKPVQHDTLFNIWSVSKAVIATALHVQADRGLIDYDAPIAEYWPEFAAKGKGGITVRHALMHRSGVPQMPANMTPERIIDWDWMVEQIAQLEPLAKPVEKPMYQAVSFGWIIGELIRRTDPKHRDVNTFVQEEINRPLGIEDLWLGVPKDRLGRIAELVDAMPPMSPESLPEMWEKCAPFAVRLMPDIFEDDRLRTAVIPAVGGIANARSVGRFFGMLANGGELDGVRILSAERVATFANPRPGGDQPDSVMFNQVMPISTAGFWLYAPAPITAAFRTSTAFGCPGAGGALGWADPGEELAVSFCHNRMMLAQTSEEDPFIPIAAAIREALAMLREAE